MKKIALGLMLIAGRSPTPALNEGCREQTAAEIRGGSHRFVKISAEVAVKLVGFIQEQAREALALSANSTTKEASGT